MAIPSITDRNVQYPNRISLTAVAGETDTYDVTLVPGNVVAEGTPINKSVLDQYAVETQTTGSSAKTTPVDADLAPLVDSEASNVLKKVTWANIKATLKTYFDTLYASKTTTFHYIGESGEPAFENSWANVGLTYVPARYWRDSLGMVHVQAALKTGTDGTVAFTLPEGFRPDYDCYFPASAGTAGAGRVLVQQSGAVTVNRGAIAQVYFHVTFPAA